MMSKERKLLEKILVSGIFDSGLYEDWEQYIQELLAQPEQEPVAWMQDSIELYVLEEKSAIRGYVIPLYTAPPKPEPLTSKLINLGNNCHESFIKGVRFAEKMHGITRGE